MPSRAACHLSHLDPRSLRRSSCSPSRLMGSKRTRFKSNPLGGGSGGHNIGWESRKLERLKSLQARTQMAVGTRMLGCMSMAALCTMKDSPESPHVHAHHPQANVKLLKLKLKSRHCQVQLTCRSPRTFLTATPCYLLFPSPAGEVSSKLACLVYQFLESRHKQTAQWGP